MQTTLNFDIDWNLIKRTHLLAEIINLTKDSKKKDELIKQQNLSLRAYRGWSTKRKVINNRCK